MVLAMPNLREPPARILVVGDGDSAVARNLRSCGHTVVELLPSDFTGHAERMADVVVVMPECADAGRIGAVAAAVARSVWFQDRPAPDDLVDLLATAGVPLVTNRDVVEECCA
jgi:hypothetical protein